jgi:hypothetical protein
MAGLKSVYEHLHNLRSRANKLAETGLALNVLFAEEDTRLQREDQASILRAVYDTIAEKLGELRRTEDSARSNDSWTNSVSFVAGLIGEAIASRDNRTSAITDYLVRKGTERKQPFGVVMVCIAPSGLPDGVEAASISQLARDSSRLESEIMEALRENGYLVFAEETFSYLIDRLTTDIRLGKLRLPVSGDKLAQILGFNGPGSSIRIVPIP